MRRLLLIFLVACGGSSSPSSNGQMLVVQAVGAASTIAAPGGTLQLAAYESVGGSYGSGSTLEQVTANWSSSNTAVATVDPNGLVTGVANGTAVITATASSKAGHFNVTVGAMPPGM